MPDNTIPDALASDLRDLFIDAALPSVALPAEDVRLRHAEGEPPSPRLTILTGDPIPVLKMDGTAKVPVMLEFASSRDRMTPEEHVIVSGKLDVWFRSIRASKRRAVLSTRVYLHEIDTKHPSVAINKEDREQVTTIRGDLMVTLVA